MYELVNQNDVLFSYSIDHIFDKMYMECSFRAKSDETVMVISEDEKSFVRERLFSAVRELSLMFGDFYVPASFSPEGDKECVFRVKCRSAGSDDPNAEGPDAVMERWIFCRLMKEWSVATGAAAMSKEFSEREEAALKEVDTSIKALTGFCYERSYTITDLN